MSITFTLPSMAFRSLVSIVNMDKEALTIKSIHVFTSDAKNTIELQHHEVAACLML